MDDVTAPGTVLYVPALQGVQDGAPMPVTYVPVAHGMQVVFTTCPVPVLKLPVGQLTHTLACRAVLNVPDEQAAHAVVAGLDAKNPATHGTHTPELQAPPELPAVPRPQSMHVTAPNRLHWP